MPQPIDLPSGRDFVAALAATPADGTLRLQYGGRYDPAVTPNVPRAGITIEAFGDATLALPRVASKAGGLFAAGKHRLTVRNIDFRPELPGRDGLVFRDCDDLAVIGNIITNHGQGLTIQGFNGRSERVTVRFNRIYDNYDPADKKGQGLYAAKVDALLIEHNLFVRNGWAPGRVPSNVLSHNVYIHQSCGPAMVLGNVFADASSHGIQMRSGGDARWNLYLDNPIHLSHGLVNGAGAPVPGGVTGEIEDNVFVGGRTIEASSTQRRGWGCELSNCKRVRVRRNLSAHDQQGEPFYQLKPCDAEDNSKAVGILDLEFSDNLAWDWRGPVLALQGVSEGATGNRGIGRLAQQPASSWAPPVAADLRTIVSLAVVRDSLKRVPTDRTVADLIQRCKAAVTVVTPPPPPPVDPQRAIDEARLLAISAELATVAEQQAALDARRKALVTEQAEIRARLGLN